MTASELIQKFNISIGTNNGNTGLKIYNKPNAAQFDEIKAKKAEIFELLEAEIAEKEAKRKATLTFYITGWESHEVSVDTRYDIEEQLKEIAEEYHNDTTLELVKRDYNKAVADIADKKAEADALKAREDEIFAKAQATGTKQVLRTYMADCDWPDCSVDQITEYAMPDGSISVIRTHTF